MYTPHEASLKTGIPLRTIQHKCKVDGVEKKNGSYVITDENIRDWIVNDEPVRNTQRKATQERKENIITEDFTIEKYNQLQMIIKNYSLRENDIKHLEEKIEIYKQQLVDLKYQLELKERSVNKLLENLQEQTKQISQKNYLKAKGLD